MGRKKSLWPYFSMSKKTIAVQSAPKALSALCVGELIVGSNHTPATIINHLVESEDSLHGVQGVHAPSPAIGHQVDTEQYLKRVLLLVFETDGRLFKLFCRHPAWTPVSSTHISCVLSQRVLLQLVLLQVMYWFPGHSRPE
jgi:hypothetical protein